MLLAAFSSGDFDFPLHSLSSEHSLQTRIEPLFYRVINTDSQAIYSAVKQAIRTKEADFFRHSVRHIYLGAGKNDFEALLRLCLDLVSFAYISPQGCPELLEMLKDARGIQRWSGSLEDLFGDPSAIDLGLPIFRTVTHLDVFDDVNANTILSAQLCASLIALPALTHLCLNRSVTVEILRRLLQECAHLQILVAMWSGRIQAMAMVVAHRRAGIVDVRYVVAVCDNYWADWDVGVRGGTDFWAASDAFVARKRRGEIEGTLWSVVSAPR